MYTQYQYSATLLTLNSKYIFFSVENKEYKTCRFAFLVLGLWHTNEKGVLSNIQTKILSTKHHTAELCYKATTPVLSTQQS